MSNLSRRHLLKTAAAGSTLFAGALTTAHATPIEPILKTVESTLSQIRRRRARGTSGLWPSSP